MSPNLSDCMPDERVAIQPPRVEWVKLSGKCPSVQPCAFSCSSRCGPKHAGLNPRDPRGLVDREHAVEPAQVHRDHGAPLARRRLEAAGDAGAAAEGDHDRVGLEGSSQDRRHLGLVPRPDHHVGEAAEVAAALAHEVAQALAARVDHPVVRVGRDLRARKRRLQRGLQRRATAGLRDRRGPRKPPARRRLLDTSRSTRA